MSIKMQRRINIDDYLGEIEEKIIKIDKIIRKGKNKDNLLSKYFFIEKKMSNYLKKIVLDNKKIITNDFKNGNNELNVIDPMSGGGLSALIITKSILEIVKDEGLEISGLNIYLSDVLYKVNTRDKVIKNKDLIRNIYDITKLLDGIPFLSISCADIMNINNIPIKDEESTNVVLLNPLITNKKINNISFNNEDDFINNDGIKNYLNEISKYASFFFYYSNIDDVNLKIANFHFKNNYKSNESSLILSDYYKDLYKIFFENNVSGSIIWNEKTNENHIGVNFYYNLKNMNPNDYYKIYAFGEVIDGDAFDDCQNEIRRIKDDIKGIGNSDVISFYNKLKGML